MVIIGMLSTVCAAEADAALARTTRTIEKILVERPHMEGKPRSDALMQLFEKGTAYYDLTSSAKAEDVGSVAESLRSMQDRIAYPSLDLLLVWGAAVTGLTRQCQQRRPREAALVQLLTHPGLRIEMRAAAVDEVVGEMHWGMSTSWARHSAIVKVCGDLIAQDRLATIHFAISSVSSDESSVGSGFIAACLLDEAYGLGLGTSESGRDVDASEAGRAWRAARAAEAAKRLPDLRTRTAEAERILVALEAGKLQADRIATSDGLRLVLGLGPQDPSLWSRLLPIALLEMRAPRGPGSEPIINLTVDGFAQWLREGRFLRGCRPAVPATLRAAWQEGTAGLPPLPPEVRSDARAWAGWIERALVAALASPLLQPQDGQIVDRQMVIKDLELLAGEMREAAAR